MLEREGIVELSVIPCPEGHALDPEELANALRDNTALVAVTHASNVTGAIQPIPQIGQICREAGIPLLVDGAQTGGVYPIDVDGWNISLLAFTGHKGLMGPQGTGGLYIGPELELKPLKYGGTGSPSLPHEMPAWLQTGLSGHSQRPGHCGAQGGSEVHHCGRIEQIRRHELELAGAARAWQRFPA